jgi:hypothetical protein
MGGERRKSGSVCGRRGVVGFEAGDESADVRRRGVGDVAEGIILNFAVYLTTENAKNTKADTGLGSARSSASLRR